MPTKFKTRTSPFRTASPTLRRAGLTLIELVLAVSIMTMSVAALAMMSRAVEISSEYNEGYGTATQHARVALNRIQRTVMEAYGNGSYCGAWLTDTTTNSTSHPDTLVVWHPTGDPANPAGPPLTRELVIYCPDAANPNRLLEITKPTDNTSMPTPGTAAFVSFVNAIKTSSGATKNALTDLVRVVNGNGVVRFAIALNPSAADWSAYQAGTKTWANLPWVQGIVGPSFGMRQVWVRAELQMVPYGNWIITNSAAQQVVPYFGSSTFNYALSP